jgi:hypothetical protein
MNHRHFESLPILGFALLIILTCFSAQAQLTTGTIDGVVFDQSGAVEVDAIVRVTNVETGITRVVRTDEFGRFSALFLPPGRYTTEGQRPHLLELSRAITGSSTPVRRVCL